MTTTITTLAQLQAMKDDLAGDYELGNNINALATSGWNGGAGFIPVGTLGTPFTGTFDMKGYTISDLFINRPTTDEVGLFGATDGATMLDVALVDCDFTGDDSVGALVGDARDTTVTKCRSSGEINGDKYVGGLIGFTFECTTSRSRSSCTVNGTDFVGGLIGWGYLSTTRRSFATGDVTGIDDDVGGLMGVSQDCDIDDSYARGDVDGDQYVGGLIGYSYKYLTTDTVDNCYSTGAVTGNSDVGGLIGYISDTVETNCFWDITTSGQATSAAGTGKITAQMKARATFGGWDFFRVWALRSVNGSYPCLCGITSGCSCLAGNPTIDQFTHQHAERMERVA